MPPKILAYIVILYLERWYPIQNSVICLKLNISPPPKFQAGCATVLIPYVPKKKDVDSSKNEVDTSLLALPEPHSTSVLGSVSFVRDAHKSLSITSSRLDDVLRNVNKFTKIQIPIEQKYCFITFKITHTF